MVTVIIKKVNNGKDFGLRTNQFQANRYKDTYTKLGYDVILIYGGL